MFSGWNGPLAGRWRARPDDQGRAMGGEGFLGPSEPARLLTVWEVRDKVCSRTMKVRSEGAVLERQFGNFVDEVFQFIRGNRFGEE